MVVFGIEKKKTESRNEGTCYWLKRENNHLCIYTDPLSFYSMLSQTGLMLRATIWKGAVSHKHFKARLNGLNICPTFAQQKLNGCWANVG